jgi:hypothetical protein
MPLKSIIALMTLILLVIKSNVGFAKEDLPNGVVDDSIRDMSIVFGAGAAGAVLGLSTLSFVDEPSKHMKNIAVGGAIGIVIGVGAVIFYQASKTTISHLRPVLPISADQFAGISKQEFQETRVVKAMPIESDALRILLPF